MLLLLRCFFFSSTLALKTSKRKLAHFFFSQFPFFILFSTEKFKFYKTEVDVFCCYVFSSSRLSKNTIMYLSTQCTKITYKFRLLKKIVRWRWSPNHIGTFSRKGNVSLDRPFGPPSRFLNFWNFFDCEQSLVLQRRHLLKKYVVVHVLTPFLFAKRGRQ